MVESKYLENSPNTCDYDDQFDEQQQEIINLFGGANIELKPQDIDMEIITIVSDFDSVCDDCKGDFKRFIERVIALDAPITLRPNLQRKVSNPKTGESCKTATKIRAIKPEEKYLDEVRTLVLGHKKALEEGLVILHIPSFLPVDNKKVREVVKNNKENIIPFSHNYIEGARDASVLAINKIEHLANGLYNPFSIAPNTRRKIVHVYDGSMMDMDTGIASTNASTRAIGQFFVPREMVEHAVNNYNVPGYHKVVVADIAKHNISEI